MAVLILTAELDLIHDAIDDIERVMRALVTYHGQSYRELERRIERLMEGGEGWGEPKWHSLSGGIQIIEPWPEMKAIISQARALGVI